MFDIYSLYARYVSMSAFDWTLEQFLSNVFNDALEHYESSTEPYVVLGFTADETTFILDYDEDLEP